MSLIDRIRGLRGPEDPRTAEIKASAQDLHSKFDAVTSGALGRLLIRLNQEQSDEILPSAEGVAPLRVEIVLFGPRAYSCALDRGMHFTLFGNDASLSNVRPKEKPSLYEALHDPFKSTPLRRSDLDKRGQKLQALAFGHRMVDVLLRVKDENPDSFINDPFPTA